MDNLYGDDANAYAKHFMEELRKHSYSKDDPIPEWEVVGAERGAARCICTKTIERLYTIRNKQLGTHLVVGCDCVKRWNIKVELKCENCSSPLGNHAKRMEKKDFLCPACKREKRRVEMECQRAAHKMDSWTLWVPGPWRGLTFLKVLQNTEWVEQLLNPHLSNLRASKSLETFQLYCEMLLEFEEVLVEVEDGGD